jgi:hypothetical protein
MELLQLLPWWREDTGADKIIEFKETGHYVLPLTLTSMFEQYDPLS